MFQSDWHFLDKRNVDYILGFGKDCRFNNIPYPVVSEGIHAIKIKFSGKYQVESPNETEIDLNGVPYKKNEIIYLKKGNYFSHAHVTYRLKLLPQPIPQLPSQFQKDHWGQMLL